ncbi:MAG: tol-pal system protein YbgF [Betaproteobacteria bacterium]
MRARHWWFALAFAALAHSAQAGMFDDEEARKKITQTNERIDALQKDLDARLAALDQQIKSQGLVDLFNQVEAIKSDIARIRGQVEVLTFELAESQKRQRDLYVDLDSRMRKLEASPGNVAPTPVVEGPAPVGGLSANAGVMPPVPAGAAPGTGSPVAAPTTPPPAVAGNPALSVSATPAPASEQRLYDGALDQFKRGDYPGAIASFNTFVKTYPRSPLAASAQYWVGNAQFARKDYRAAIAAQRQLLQSYPDSTKVPDALLNIASAQSELGDSASARRTLEELIAKFPQSESAGKAKQRLGIR